ncbi:hypothetical protein [Variovorax rhizosphaerae]|uniref:Uncharacterized protein n=1 Tax=Variovorax rhizosphaerae TaxID=1836200 RepID=A0ABU8WRL1_9BURK
MRCLFFAELQKGIVESLLERPAFRLGLRQQARLQGELIAQLPLDLLGGLLRFSQHPAAGLQRLRRGFFTSHALLLLPGQPGFQLLRGLARPVDLLMRVAFQGGVG